MYPSQKNNFFFIKQKLFLPLPVYPPQNIPSTLLFGKKLHNLLIYSSLHNNWLHQLCKKFSKETIFNIWRNEKYFLVLLIYQLFGYNLGKIQ